MDMSDTISRPGLEESDQVDTKPVEEGIEAINLSEVPHSSNQNASKYYPYPLIPSPHLIQLPKLSCQERYDIYCKEVKIAACRPAQVLNRVHSYLEENLMNKKWLALWRGPCNGSLLRTVDILVEVTDVCAEQASVTLVSPLVCSEPSIPREVIEAQLDELDYTLDVIELYPVTIIEDPDSSCSTSGDEDDDNEAKEVARMESKIQEEIKQRFIALVVDNARFFFEHIRRDWDDEDEGEQAFDAYLRARLRLFYDVAGGLIPPPLVARYNRTMAKYFVRRKELLDYQARIQNEGEPTNSEAVECWRKYYEVLMLSGLLQIWETLQLRAEGPCFPRVLRRSKGPRDDKTVVTHIVVEQLTPAMLRKYPDDIAIQQHKTPQSALLQCYEGDTIVVYPGVYSGEGFHELTESVIIKGEGERDEITIEAIPFDDLFVNVSAANVTLENLTFVQAENTEGILRVESGHAQIFNCALKCDGTGITVREGARLTMRDSSITGAKGAGVELMPGCSVVLENNHIHNFAEQLDLEGDQAQDTIGKGGIHLHVVDPPKIRLIGNRICSDGGYGITVGRKRATSFDNLRNLSSDDDGRETVAGDASAVRSLNEKVDDSLKKFVDIEMSNNTIEELIA